MEIGRFLCTNKRKKKKKKTATIPGTAKQEKGLRGLRSIIYAIMRVKSRIDDG